MRKGSLVAMAIIPEFTVPVIYVVQKKFFVTLVCSLLYKDLSFGKLFRLMDTLSGNAMIKKEKLFPILMRDTFTGKNMLPLRGKN